MRFSELLASFEGKRAVVVGDLMLDEYLFTRAERISPEAPVMVVRHQRTERLPGGAANVARNVAAFGAKVDLVGLVGSDEGGDMLSEALQADGLSASGLIRSTTRTTTRKTRVVADHAHQVLRIDHEEDHPATEAEAKSIVESVRARLADASVLVLSDYLKGTLSAQVAQELVRLAHAQGVPTVVNPKPRSLAQYRGAKLVSLNRLEAAQAMDLPQGLSNDLASEAARALRERIGAESVLVTLGDAGMVADNGETMRVPAPRVEVYDTAGAGDTVIATVALGVASAGIRREVFELAAQTAACVIQHVGVATPTRDDLARLAALP